MSLGGDELRGGGCPIKNPFVTKVLLDDRPIFYPIMADFCKFFRRLGAAPPSPLSPTSLYIIVIFLGALLRKFDKMSVELIREKDVEPLFFMYYAAMQGSENLPSLVHFGFFKNLLCMTPPCLL